MRGQRRGQLFNPKAPIKIKKREPPGDYIDEPKTGIDEINEEERKLRNSLDFAARLRLGKLYDDFIVKDLESALKYDLFSRKWVNLVYLLISNKRTEFKDMDAESKKYWKNYMIAVSESYTTFVKNNSGELAKSLLAKLFVHLGDINRYLALYICESEFDDFLDEAESYYTVALVTTPKNSHIQSQLALCKVMKKLYFEGAYLYFRALCAEKPFPSARESLLGIFLKVEKENSQGIELIEKSILQIVANLFNKIDLEKLEKKLNLLKKNIRKSGGLILEKDFMSQRAWWFTLAMILVSIGHITSQNVNYDPIVKQSISKLWGKLISVLLEEFLSIFERHRLEGIVIFIHVLFTWLTQNIEFGNFLEVPKGFEKILKLDETKHIGRVEDIFEKDTLPEDILLFDFMPFEFLNLTATPTLKDIKFAFESNAFSDQREKRARILLSLNIGNFKFAEKSTERDNFESRPVLKIQESKQNDQKVFSFEEFIKDDHDSSYNGDNNYAADSMNASNILQESLENLPGDEVLQLKALKESLVENETDNVLVFDTNAIIQYRDSIIKIINSRKFNVLIPLTVISELYGLQETFPKIAKFIEFVNDNLHDNLFRIQTSNGDYLVDTDFRNEKRGTTLFSSDDVILETCEQHKGVHLVSDDLNMRLKGRTRGFEVTCCRDFFKNLKY